MRIIHDIESPAQVGGGSADREAYALKVGEKGPATGFRVHELLITAPDNWGGESESICITGDAAYMRAAFEEAIQVIDLSASFLIENKKLDARWADPVWRKADTEKRRIAWHERRAQRRRGST